MNRWDRDVMRSMMDTETQVLETLKRQYEQALREINHTIRMLEADQSMQSRVFQLEYQKALREQVTNILDTLRNNNFVTISQYLEQSYTDGFVGTMYSIAGQGVPLICPLNQNEIVHAVTTNSKLSTTLYEALGQDMQALKRTVTGEITRGTVGGLSWREIGTNISVDAGVPMRRAQTIARTEGHRIQQEASDDARQAAIDRGCDVVKQWDSTLDESTRDSHKALDGQIRKQEEYFEIDGHRALYPSGFGIASEDVNCRCVALTRAKWGLDEDELETMKERAAYFGLDKTDSFREYERKYLTAVQKEGEEE